MAFTDYEKTKSQKSKLEFHVSCPNFTISKAFGFSPRHWLFFSFLIFSLATISFEAQTLPYKHFESFEFSQLQGHSLKRISHLFALNFPTKMLMPSKEK